MYGDSELQGVLSVKSPSRIRTRRFLPWKTWKKQWVVLRRCHSPATGLDLLVGRSAQTVIHIAPEDVLIRTESRTHQFAFGVFPSSCSRRAHFYLAGASETETQHWIATIRALLTPPRLDPQENEFAVSIIDNAFSRSSGLAAVHGILTVSADHVAIVDPCTCAARVQWPWNELSQFYVSSPIAAEDEGHVCSILTASKFAAGVGRVHLYCEDAVGLTTRLLTKGRPSSLIPSPVPRVTTPYRHYTFSFKFPERGPKTIKTTPSSPLLFPHGTLRKLSTASRGTLGRRLSRSEGNLRAACDRLDRSGRTTPSSHDSGEKSSLSSEDSTVTARGRVASSLISAGFGLMLSTAGCEASEQHEYQRVGLEGGDSGDSEDELGGLTFTALRCLPPRRESGVSVASGVYEEIEDVAVEGSKLWPLDEGEGEEPPPPLPPRRGLGVKSASGDLTDSGYTNTLQIPRVPGLYQSRSAGNTPLPSPPGWPSLEESNYLPMSPGRLKPKEEQLYLAMTPRRLQPKEEQLYLAMTPGRPQPKEEQLYLAMTPGRPQPKEEQLYLAMTPGRQQPKEEQLYLTMSPGRLRQDAEEDIYLAMSPGRLKQAPEEQHYLTMSPGLLQEAEDQHYMVMASVNTS